MATLPTPPKAVVLSLPNEASFRGGSSMTGIIGVTPIVLETIKLEDEKKRLR
jgi:hypothetical protein